MFLTHHPFPQSSPCSNAVQQPSSFPLPPVNIQAVEADWAERFLARAQLEQIRPPGHIYCSTPAPAKKTCPAQLSSKCEVLRIVTADSFCTHLGTFLRQLVLLEHDSFACFTACWARAAVWWGFVIHWMCTESPIEKVPLLINKVYNGRNLYIWYRCLLFGSLICGLWVFLYSEARYSYTMS